MKKLAAAAFVASVATGLFGATNSGIGLDAFNRAVSAATRGNAVFSPVSFEIDSVIFSEAFGALIRAKFAETMGVLNGLEAVYLPLHQELTKQDERNFSLLNARAFCLPDERKTHPAYRQWMQKTFSAEAFTFDFHKGAECWFRARMDGEMEDFHIPAKAAPPGYYSYYDLVSFRCHLENSFPTNNTREIKFKLPDGTECTLPAMCDTRPADIWKRKNSDILRLKLSNSVWFFAVLPHEGLSTRDIRGEISSGTIIDILVGIKSITEADVSHGVAEIAVPKIDITTETDLKLPFGYFHFPMTDMDRMEKSIQPRYIRQCVRFQLDEKGADEAAGEKTPEQVVVAGGGTTRFALDRPFLFFVYHEPTTTIPVVGQFMGR